MSSQARKLKYLNSTTFQVFHNPYEPCLRGGQILDISTGIAEAKVRIPVQQTWIFPVFLATA